MQLPVPGKPPSKTNYLNNRDILKEIHLSKNTYCSYADPVQDHQYDIILPSVNKINQRTVAEARRNRADRIRRETGVDLDPKKIPNTDLVFRVTTWEHIPMVPRKVAKSTAKKQRIEDMLELDMPEDDALADLIDDPVLDTQHMRVNFPPFWHYRIDDNREPYVVGKSHWQGNLVHGQFSREHGTMTRRLAMMFMKLCERYATRSNWRGYCVDQDTEALTQRGWLGINDIKESDRILSYNGSALAWSGIKSIFRSEFDGLMHQLTSRGFDSLITPNHKVVTERGLVPVELLLEKDRVLLLADEVATTHDPIYSDSFVELAAWIVTEGCYEIDPAGNVKRITVYQNPGALADRIRACLVDLGYQFSESLQKGRNICFGISRADSRTIAQQLPTKNLNMRFVLSLTAAQRHLMINTMIDGDGWYRPGGHRSYTQKNQEHQDLFMALCAMSGIRTTSRLVHSQSFGKPVSYYSLNLLSASKNQTVGHCIDMHGGKRNGRGQPGQGKVTHPNVPTTAYTGQVWCPETEYGCFVARRNGTVYLTGNTYNEEMRGQALLQLSQIGLQFDESKSQNPFAYYTAAITNSFTRVLNIEKKMQNIRDDILEMNGLNPSWTRQNSGKPTSAQIVTPPVGSND